MADLNLGIRSARRSPTFEKLKFLKNSKILKEAEGGIWEVDVDGAGEGGVEVCGVWAVARA